MASDTMPATGFFEKHRDKIAFAGPDECWLWTAGKTSKGYGQVWARGATGKAHREAYEAERGTDSADGMVVRHKCDVRACVNPAHLELGTHADNVRDRHERGRSTMGEAHGAAKLTEADVRTIRTEYVFGSRTHGLRPLGRRFGVHHSVIDEVIRRERWKHI